MKRLVVSALPLVMLLSGCGNKETTAQPQTAAPPAAPAKPAPPPNPALLEPASEFTDAARQQQYEALFREYLASFAAPVIGSSIWLTLTDGGKVLGLVEKVEETMDGCAIHIKTEHHIAKLPASYLDAESRSRIFQSDFARHHAMARVNGQPVDSGTPVGKPYARYPLHDGITPRMGPGIHFRRIDSTKFSHDTALTICSESGGWIEVQTPAKETHQWLPRFETFDMDELNLEARQRDLDILTKTGLAERVIPENNELFVDPGMWSTMNPDIRLGIARAIAAYCAASQKKTILLLTVIDSTTQNRLGKYSGTRGWVETVL